MITLALDMMGSDLGPEELAKGVALFEEKHGDSCRLILVGKKENLPEGKHEIVDAPDALPMETGAMDALRAKNSSMHRAVNLVKEGKAQGVVSCGATGAFLSIATVLLRKVPGIDRAAFVAPFPTKIKGKPVIILDVGASNENSAKELQQFALLGTLYARLIYGIEKPKTYLLSNGAEEGKGSPIVKEAYALLKEDPKINFQGNIEARETLEGEADVIVCDGFTGNILLKSTEGTAKLMSGFIKKAFKRNILSKIGYLFARKGFKEMTETMDYKNVGGAMLLGVNGVVVKAHGSSDGTAFYHSIEVAYRLLEKNLLEQIKQGLDQNE
ncbi:MAG: phosphate acyltransferase PlsX [Bacilli bacterium]|nr:phosphate acyltransferase PlsX [Bacilli bacterium]